MYSERATEGANEADGPSSAPWGDGVEQIHHRADALGQVALELGQLLAGAEQLVCDVQRGQRQGLDRILAAHLPFDALDALLDVGREVANVFGIGLAPDRVFLPEDLDLDPLHLAHRSSFSISLSMTLTCDSVSLRSRRRR